MTLNPNLNHFYKNKTKKFKLKIKKFYFYLKKPETINNMRIKHILAANGNVLFSPMKVKYDPSNNVPFSERVLFISELIDGKRQRNIDE
jgi:hypothetical protein